jgi:hypothetical protein
MFKYGAGLKAIMKQVCTKQGVHNASSLCAVLANVGRNSNQLKGNSILGFDYLLDDRTYSP